MTNAESGSMAKREAHAVSLRKKTRDEEIEGRRQRAKPDTTKFNETAPMTE